MCRLTNSTAHNEAKTCIADRPSSEEVQATLRDVRTSARNTFSSPARRDGHVLAACAKCWRHFCNNASLWMIFSIKLKTKGRVVVPSREAGHAESTVTFRSGPRQEDLFSVATATLQIASVSASRASGLKED
jgi:hypothetical protein